jgi:hypothetical protein
LRAITSHDHDTARKLRGLSAPAALVTTGGALAIDVAALATAD